MQFSRKDIKKTMSILRFKTFGMWFLTAVIPLIILVGYVAAFLGPNLTDAFLNPNRINEEIWQLNKWNRGETVYRIINNLILESPEDLIDPEGVDELREYDAIKRLDYIIIVRRGDVFYAINDFTTDEGQAIVEKLKSVDGLKLPEFGNVNFTNNGEILDQTGYSILRQLDFYFGDGTQGSVFFFVKVINIPGLFGHIVISYFAILFVLYFIIVGGLSVISTYKISKRLENIIYATEEISREQFDIKMNSRGNSPFAILETQIEHMAKKLATAKHYRASMQASREAFINTMAHDLKTPLTAIKMQVAALKDGVVKEPKQVNQYLLNIERKVDNIDQMLTELKVFSNLLTEDEHYDYQRVKLSAFAKDIAEEWQFDAGEDIHFDFDFDPQESYLSLDPMKFQRVLVNIFENALKYVTTRPLNLSIKVRMTTPEKIRLSIMDNGFGVPEEKLSHLFDLYYRVDDSRNQVISGSGLGLAICREIIEKHGGQITAQNDVTGGLVIVIDMEVKDA